MHKRLYDMTNAEYFANETHLSSSGLKLLLEEPEAFYKKYILKSVKNERKEYFDLGSAIHCKVLEPHKFDNEVTFYDGAVKRGKIYDDFVEKNSGKIILGNLAKEKLDRMADSISRHAKVQELLNISGYSEVSFFTELEGVSIKVRADRISFEGRFILDLKSVSDIISERTFSNSVERLSYDLSAALYLDAINKVLEELGEPLMDRFYWPVSSSTHSDTKLFCATDELIERGRKKYKRAIETYKYYSENGWKFNDTIIYLLPKKTWEE